MQIINIDPYQDLSIRKQSDLLELNRSSLYYKNIDKKLLDQNIANKIYEIWLESPFYGYRKIKATLNRQGEEINHKKIKRLMQEMNISSIFPGKKKINLSQPNDTNRKHPYLLKDLKIDRVNQVWVTDITYIKMLTGGFTYFIAIMDLYSRFITSAILSTNLEAGFCIKAMTKSINQYSLPEIFNTDQGSQFTSNDWIKLLQKNNIKISMDGKGRCFDNIFAERLWRTIKYEEVYLKSYDTVLTARKELEKFVEFYNYKRPHQSLKYNTPSDIYFGKEKL